MPFLCAFYLNYRTKQNDIGYELAKIDKAFKRKLLQIVPKATPEEVNTIFAIYFGIGWSPYVTEKEIAIFCGIIRNIFKEIQSRP